MRRRIAGPALAAALLAGCEGSQSVLAPMGPEAERIAELTWLLFAGGTAIFLVTMLLLVLALGGGQKLRGLLGARRTILAGGIAFPIVVLSALLLHTLGLAGALDLRGGEEPLRIEVTGKQFWWDVRYPSEDVVTANEIHIPVGREIELHVDSSDVIHSLWIPSLHGKIDMIPGRVNTLRFRAGKAGILRGQCAEFCGAQHALMAFFVVAESDEAFAGWLARQRTPVEEPADEFLALGWRAFGTAGCGACHAVRGTSWTSRIGPDLTRVGGRLSLAAGALDNHLATLAGWIGGPQAIKPGAAMPAFNSVLEGYELRALATWLDTLE